jgi:hypothetical protein
MQKRMFTMKGLTLDGFWDTFIINLKDYKIINHMWNNHSLI